MADRDGRDQPDQIRDTGEQSRHGAPAVGAVIRDRFETDEVFQRIIAAADEEVTTTSRELFFSALAGGFAITLTFLMYASMTSKTGGAPVLSALLYPIGFIYIILGGYQLYTENTLPPVALTIERLASIPAMLRQWVIVLLGNFAGGLCGALVLAYTGVFSPEVTSVAIDISMHGIETGWWDLFFKGGFAGLIVAGVVWLDFAVRDTISRFLLVYIAFLTIPLADLFHVVVSFTELMYLVFLGEASIVLGMAYFVLPVLLGNTLGGVLLVTVVNYFQTSEQRLESARLKGLDRRLSIPEWALGRVVGRSYVPLLDTAEAALVDDDVSYRVMVPITNPRTDSQLVELACILASQRESATVHGVHIVQAPREMSLSTGGHLDRITDESTSQMELAQETADQYDVEFEISSVVTHRSFEEIFDVARRTRPDVVVMGWGDDQLWSAARAERPVEELTNQLPCDFLIINDRTFDASRILLSTAGGPDMELGAEVARALQSTIEAEISLLHVVDDPGERETGERFLSEWAADQNLEDVVLTVDDSGDVEEAIKREAEGKTLVVIGASERGLLSRLLADSLHLDVVSEVECPVLLAERPSQRSIRERLFGRGRRAESSGREQRAKPLEQKT